MPIGIPPPADPAVRRRFQQQRTTGTQPELQLRRELHGRGLRFRVHYKVEGMPRRRVDIAFTRRRLAVMVDGCFWHGCPQHCVTPKSNRDWWLSKLETNRVRDADTNARLKALGWSVLRVWEHTPPEAAAMLVEREYRNPNA